jgi:hypothetical protein
MPQGTPIPRRLEGIPQMFNRRINQDTYLHGKEVKMKGGTMICPHCTVSFHIESATEYWLTQENNKDNRYLYKMICLRARR